MKIFARFKKDESGATAIEYGLIAALIAVVIIIGAGMVGGSLDATFRGISTTLDSAGTPATPTTPPAETTP